MKENKHVFFTDRLQWREWLLKHFETESEIWFVYNHPSNLNHSCSIRG